jgi:hypothetical protein
MILEKTFPLCYCLNLAKRQDRRVRCEELFEAHALRVWRFPAVNADRVKRKHGFESAGRFAHSISTRMIIRRAMQLKAPAVWIFEDDVILAEDWRERLEAMELPEDWGMFYLGCQHQRRPDVVKPGLVRVRGALDTHAWGIRATHYRRALAALAGRHERGYPLPPADVLLARQQERDEEFVAYAAFPNLAWQEEEHTDLVGGVYSNYDADGWQRPARKIIAGTCAEALGGRAWASAAAEAKEVVPFYGETADRQGQARNTRSEQREDDGVARKVVHPAFLFLTRGDIHHPKLWQEYLEGSEAECYSICAHAADRTEVNTTWLRNAQILEHVETTWGSISLVRAMLALLRVAVTDERNTHFVFLSESCLPIRPLKELRRLLTLDGRSRFFWETRDEVAIKHPEKARRMDVVRGVPRGMGRFHSQWLLLDREAAALLVEDDFTEVFAECWAPDEFYFATVLEMKGWPLKDKVVRQDVTWTNWSNGGQHPHTYTTVTPQLAAVLAASGAWFARKFAASSVLQQYGLHNMQMWDEESSGLVV